MKERPFREDSEIDSDLASGDPERIRAGLLDLNQRRCNIDGYDRPPITPEIIAPLGDDVDEETILALIYLIVRYPRFVPPLDALRKYAYVGTLGARCGYEFPAFEAALALKCAEDPVRAVQTALAAIPRELRSEAEILSSCHFVSCLLDGGPPVRAATLDALASWPQDEFSRRVRRYIERELAPEELEQLRLEPGRPATESGS